MVILIHAFCRALDEQHGKLSFPRIHAPFRKRKRSVMLAPMGSPEGQRRPRKSRGVAVVHLTPPYSVDQHRLFVTV